MDNAYKDLICPSCRSTLQISNEFLLCIKCNKKYLIKDNVILFKYEDVKSYNASDKEYEYWNKLENTVDNLYENLSDKAFNELIDYCEISSNTTGLELGCGDGPFARRLLNKNLKIFGLDISFPLLRLTKNMIPVQGDATCTPFKNNYFDWIIYAFALHHMPDHGKALEEAIRVLKPGGKLFIIEPNYYHPQRYLTRKPDMFFRKYIFTYFTPEERWVPVSIIRKVFKKQNMILNKCEFVTPVFNSNSISGKIQRLISKVFNFYPFKKYVHSYYFITATKST